MNDALLKSETKTVEGWGIAVNYGQFSNPKIPSVHERCGNGQAWYGWNGGFSVGSLNAKLVGNGKASLDFGNCWSSGTVTAYVDNQAIGIANANTPSKVVVFDYYDGSILKLSDSWGNSVIQFNKIEHIRCKSKS